MIRRPLVRISLLAFWSLSFRTPAAEPMAFPGARWEEARPEALGVDSAKLGAAIAYLEKHSGSDGVRKLVIVRDGRMIWRGERVDEVQGVWSVTKSLTSTVLGLLVSDRTCTLDAAVRDYLPELEAAYPSVTLRHLTTMTSGYRAVGDETQGGYTHGPSRTPFVPHPIPLFPPAAGFAYWDSAMNELGNALTRIASEPMEDLIRRRIAEPIDMSPDGWAWGDFGPVGGLVVNGGSGNHGKHLRISARELARLGHLFLNRGRWRGNQLLSPSWVEQATRAQVPATLSWAHPESGIDGRGVYGFNWWTNGRQPDGRRKWPGAPAGAYAAMGYNNNSMFVVPEWSMVIVRLGLDQNDRKIGDEVYGTFLNMIGRSIVDGSRDSVGWRFRGLRDEIAPLAWRDENVRIRDRPTLSLAGGGLAAANGCWVREVSVEPGEHYLFEARYTSNGVEEPLRSVLARILWRDEEGRRIGRAEYPATVCDGDSCASGIIRQTYRAPPRCAVAELELVYRWDAEGTVHFEAARFLKAAPPSPRRVRLASVHHYPRGSSGPRANLKAFSLLVARAAEKRADIVCLPEGITVAGTGKTYIDVSESVPGPTTRVLGDLCRRHRLYVVAGIYERQASAVYNTAVLIDRDGRLAGKYRKVCLPREEIQGGITPGDRLPVFDTDFGRIGLMICWDVFFPEPARTLAQQGAEVIFLPIWGGNLTLAKARAIENQVYLVSSTYDMKTAVFDREGAIVAEGSDDEPVIVVEVDLSERKLWPWLGDFRNRIPREMPTRAALRAAK